MNGFSITSPRRLVALSVLVVGLALTVTGCDDTSVAPTPSEESSSEPTDPGAPLPPDVRLRIEYDQTEVTYSNVWPGSIVGNDEAEKAKKKGAQLMTEFEKTHEVRSYDNEGYLHRTYEYIGGNHPGMNMPSQPYSDLRKEMPYDPNDENPIVKYELEGSSMKYIRKDGTVAHETVVDPERYRVDPEKLDSLKAAQEDTADTDERRAAVRQSLQRQGHNLTQFDENRVSFTRELEQDRGASRVKTVVDLRFGKSIYQKFMLKNGQTDMVVTRQYARTSGLPVMRRSVTYNYDDRTGDWKVVTRTELTRNNISVRIN
jgi:hypothetical protein